MRRKMRTKLSNREIKEFEVTLDDVVTNLPKEIADTILDHKKDIKKACEVVRDTFKDVPFEIVEASLEMKALIERMRRQGGGFVGM